MIYLACISLVYVLWELLSVFTEYLEPSCFCFSPLPNLKLNFLTFDIANTFSLITSGIRPPQEDLLCRCIGYSALTETPIHVHLSNLILSVDKYLYIYKIVFRYIDISIQAGGDGRPPVLPVFGACRRRSLHPKQHAHEAT